MVPPFSQVEYATPSSVRQAEWMLINDYGGNSKTYKAEIKRGSKA
jgi:P pilus assembly chaperone PapD